MKRIHPPLILLLSLFALRTPAQKIVVDLPETAYVPHYRLALNINTTTVLVFRAAVKPVDRGDRDVIAQKQPGVENVLKLKAARKHFEPTNLHVFTADGRLYAFDLTYTDSLATTYNLTALDASPGPDQSLPTVSYSFSPLNTDEFASDVDSVLTLPRSHTTATRGYRMRLQLENVAYLHHLLYFRLGIANHSDLDYTINFIRFYIRDRRRVKRSSVQQQEILPVYQDSTAVIPGRTTRTRVFALPPFTYSNSKELVIECYEVNGGRSLSLPVLNKHLFFATKL